MLWVRTSTLGFGDPVQAKADASLREQEGQAQARLWGPNPGSGREVQAGLLWPHRLSLSLTSSLEGALAEMWGPLSSLCKVARPRGALAALFSSNLLSTPHPLSSQEKRSHRKSSSHRGLVPCVFSAWLNSTAQAIPALLDTLALLGPLSPLKPELRAESGPCFPGHPP